MRPLPAAVPATWVVIRPGRHPVMVQAVVLVAVVIMVAVEATAVPRSTSKSTCFHSRQSSPSERHRPY